MAATVSNLFKAIVRRVFCNKAVADEFFAILDKIDPAGGAEFTGNVSFGGSKTIQFNNTVTELHLGTEQHNGSVTNNGNNFFTNLLGLFPNRIIANQGTAIVAGNFTLSGGFGNTASLTVPAGARDTRFNMTISSAGTGQGLNPTITLPFRDGAFPVAPVAIASRSGGNQSQVQALATANTTHLVITFNGTPVSGDQIGINVHVLG